MAGTPRMVLKAEVKNLRQFLFSVKNEIRRAKENYNTRVVVGYSAPYAIFVHEDLNVDHPIGRAKFLEEPARELADEMAQIIADHVAGGGKMWKGQEKAGQFLLKASKDIVPVSYAGSGGNPPGFLRDSGFVVVEYKG